LTDSFLLVSIRPLSSTSGHKPPSVRFLSLQRLPAIRSLELWGLPRLPRSCVLRVLHPLNALLPKSPCGLVSFRFHSWDFPLQGLVPIAMRHSSFNAPDPHDLSRCFFRPNAYVFRALFIAMVAPTCLRLFTLDMLRFPSWVFSLEASCTVSVSSARRHTTPLVSFPNLAFTLAMPVRLQGSWAPVRIPSLSREACPYGVLTSLSSQIFKCFFNVGFLLKRVFPSRGRPVAKPNYPLFTFKKHLAEAH
jgi:hypothetical protein